MRSVFVKPADGTKVRNPDAGFAHLPPEGAKVHMSPYWKQMIREGAVTETQPPSAKPAPARHKAAPRHAEE